MHAAICEQKMESMGGLPRQGKSTVNHQYHIISNTGNTVVEDQLIIGTQNCVKYIQPQKNSLHFPAIVWI